MIDIFEDILTGYNVADGNEELVVKPYENGRAKWIYLSKTGGFPNAPYMKKI
jgi:hypothetical protein